MKFVQAMYSFCRWETNWNAWKMPCIGMIQADNADAFEAHCVAQLCLSVPTGHSKDEKVGIGALLLSGCRVSETLPCTRHEWPTALTLMHQRIPLQIRHFTNPRPLLLLLFLADGSSFLQGGVAGPTPTNPGQGLGWLLAVSRGHWTPDRIRSPCYL